MKRYLPPRTPQFVLGATVLALVGVLGDFQMPEPRASEPPVVVPTPSSPPPLAVSRAYQAAATRFRNGDEEGARSALRDLALQAPSQAARVDTVLGLHAYAEGRYQEALGRLTGATSPGDDLADWRLFALAESAARSGDQETADAALDGLLRSHPDSPLRGPALLTMANLSAERGATSRALEILGHGREARFGREIALELDVLTWKLARQGGDRGTERSAARRLLVSSPTAASELGVLDSLRPSQGILESWAGILSAEEVLQRARAWLDEGSPTFATATLETIPEARRTFHWDLLRAEALTALDRGNDAYVVLAAARPPDPSQQARLEWQRAMAAADVAVAKRGRKNLPSAERRFWLERSREHLEKVVTLDVPGDVSLDALRALYAHLAEEDRFEDSMAILRLMRRIDPEDRTGATRLWELGWDELQSENYTGAIGYWSQLEQIYPEDRETHRGRYWKARALEEIGQRDRAEQLYRDLIRTSDTADFYVRRAQGRLLGEHPLQTPGSLSGNWPTDPRLQRIFALSELALDELAAQELEVVARTEADLDARDVLGLEGLLQVRRGDIRSGVQSLRKAFPSLGGAHQATIPGPILEAYYPLPFQETIAEHARYRDLEPALVAGIIRQESAFDAGAESWAGARGLMQLMPATAKEVAQRLGHRYDPEQLFDPGFSIELGTTYFRYVLDRFDGNVELALAGYNGGPNRIRRLWREAGPDPELDLFLEGLGISESRNYVKRILVLSDSYRQLYSVGP